MDFYQFLKTLTPLRQKQLRTAVFVNLIDSAEDLSTFSKYEREMVAREFSFVPFAVKSEQRSRDGSIKWALELADGNVIETVLMQFKDGRNTVCVSSQVGCASKCLFCATGQLGFKRNLSAWEIVSQVLFAGRYLRKSQKSKIKSQNNGGLFEAGLYDRQTTNDRRLTNVVFMGMGEPLLNTTSILLAIAELNDPNYFNLGRRHMTLSTFGPTIGLNKFIEAETGVTLAISLHAPNQTLRQELMPVTKGNTIEDLFRILDNYVRKTNKRVSYEYIMLDGVNDTDKCASELAELLKDRLSFVNLIGYNTVSGAKFIGSRRQQVERFRSILERNGIATTVRVSLGDEIDAACGQLAGEQ